MRKNELKTKSLKYIISMSTSRSIASAINRRAGNNAPRPNVGMQQQPNYNSKMPPPPGPGQPMPKNVRFVPSGPGVNQPPQEPQPPRRYSQAQQPTIPVKTPGVNGAVGQVSISDAFALVTIRLGKVEQFIQQVQEEGLPNSSTIDNESFKIIEDRILFQEQQGNQSLEEVGQIKALCNEIKEQLTTMQELVSQQEKKEKETNELLHQLQQDLIQVKLNYSDLLKSKESQESMEVVEEKTAEEKNTNKEDSEEELQEKND
jgi:hypothetical protein